MKRAQLVADVVSVLCPMCGEPQPNPYDDGSEMWSREAINRTHSTLKCVACDEFFITGTDTKVQFQ